MELKIIELFGGIGSARQALENLGITTISDYVDLDKFATKSYNAIWDETFKPTDIREYTPRFINADLLVQTPPCQDISVAGGKKGIEKDSGTRSALMWDTLPIIKKTNPKVILWENVDAILSDKNSESFDKYITELKEMGYTTTYCVLNATEFSSAQNRKRMFAVSLKDECFDFNNIVRTINENALLEVIDFESIDPDMHFYTEDNFKHYHALKEGMTETYKVYQWRRKYVRGMNGRRCPTLTANMGTGGNNVPIIKTKYGLRKLTTRECWRLMGFPDSAHDAAKASGVSNSQLYKQAGNSVVVSVLEAIFKELYSPSNTCD